MTNRVRISGINVTYAFLKCDISTNTTLVFLHGWGGTKESWKDNTDILSKNFNCVALTLPGFGDSQEPTEPWDTFEYARFVRKFIKSLKINKPVLVGKSFGGRISIAYASTWPNELSKLVLVSSAGIEEKTIYTRSKITVMKFLGKVTGLVPGVDKTLMRQTIYRFLGLREESPYKREVKKLVTNQDLSMRLPLIQAKTLIVWGTNDKILPLALSEKLNASIENSELKTIRGGDHWVHEKQSKEFNKLIIKFLS